ncbi:MAG: hypothetical protein OEY52_17615, partial [Gammaproteobacteria bacterium]|nr:hypothetical protein [Gammaproteobacteria bacterium]
MKNVFSLLATLMLGLTVGLTPVHAVVIGGEISISGGFVPGEGASLADATSIDFLEWNGTSYVSGTAGGSFTVAAVSGDFADYVTPSPFILGNINDFSFDSSFTPVSPLWEIGGFAFDLTSVSVDTQSDTTLVLYGQGFIYGNGFDVTEGRWILTGNSLGSTFSWSSTTVPEAPTLALLAIALLGL